MDSQTPSSVSQPEGQNSPPAQPPVPLAQPTVPPAQPPVTPVQPPATPAQSPVTPVQPPVTPVAGVPVVECEHCKEPIYGKPKLNLMGQRIYKCSSCGKKTTYPFSNLYFVIYIICIVIFGFGVLSILAFGGKGGFGCCGGIGLLAIPFLFIDHQIKKRIPDYKERIKNSEREI